MRLFCLALLAVLVGTSAHAQPSTGLPLPASGSHVSVTLVSPRDDTGETTFVPLSLLVDAETRVVGGLRFQGTLAGSFLFAEFGPDAEADLALGNTYLGLALDPVSVSLVQIEAGVGVWLPSSELNEGFETSGTLLFAGVRSSPDRIGAFWPLATSPSGYVQVEAVGPEGLVGRLRVAPTAIMGLRDGNQFEDRDDIEVAISTVLQGEATIGTIRAVVGVEANRLLTEADDRFESTYLGVGAEAPVGGLRLGVHLRAGLTDDGAAAIASAGLTVPL